MTGAWMPLVRAVRDAGWLTAERARAWCLVLALVTAAIAAAVLLLSRNGLDPHGKPIGTDFMSFWTASRLVLEQGPASPYDVKAHMAAQRAAMPPGQAGYYAFFYPPTFLLLCLPLGLLPYLPSLALWLAAGFAALLACVRQVLPRSWTVLPVLAFPAVLVNAGHGQNGFVSAACFGGCMTLMQRRPFLAGVCLGGLVIKPHLALAAPVALLAARRWAVVAGAAASSLSLAAASWLILGTDAWRGFLAGSSLARATLEQGLVEPWKMQSAFAAVRVLHGGVGPAYAVQAIVALGTCVVLARVASQQLEGQALGALLTVSTLACTPFLLDYDLVCLILPMAWVAAQAQRSGWLPWEKAVLLASYVLPIFSRTTAMLGMPVAPIILASLLLVTARRAALANGRLGCQSLGADQARV